MAVHVNTTARPVIKLIARIPKSEAEEAAQPLKPRMVVGLREVQAALWFPGVSRPSGSLFPQSSKGLIRRSGA
jgi:hypothetical protein